MMDRVGHRVLLAEDDRAIRDALTRALELEGHEVVAVGDGAAALDVIRERVPDVVVLDWMMPVVDGLTVCRRLRAEGSDVAVLMLTARTEVSDRVSGLDAGADDYLSKPFALDELLARVRALLRRSAADDATRTWRVADLFVDPSARRAWRGTRELELTKTEFELLLVLVRNAGIVCTHSAIYDAVWGYDFGPESKTLAVYVGYLRRKLEQGGEARLSHTVRGVGYTLRAL
jgi:two-component system response regulator MprA